MTKSRSIDGIAIPKTEVDGQVMLRISESSIVTTGRLT